MRTIHFGTASILLSGVAASAAPVLQFDVKQFDVQAQTGNPTTNGPYANSLFGGTSHTGRLLFSASTGSLAGMFMQNGQGGKFTNAGLSGFGLSNFDCEVKLSNGSVTGGSITLTLSNGDFYTCNIAPGSGGVSSTTPGGFKIEGFTQGGMFADSVFGNVNVAPWFNSQGSPGGLAGSFLKFNFDPTQADFGNDMTLFVDIAPLPPAAWLGMATLAGVGVMRRFRRR